MAVKHIWKVNSNYQDQHNSMALFALPDSIPYSMRLCHELEWTCWPTVGVLFLHTEDIEVPSKWWLFQSRSFSENVRSSRLNIFLAIHDDWVCFHRMVHRDDSVLLDVQSSSLSHYHQWHYTCSAQIWRRYIQWTRSLTLERVHGISKEETSETEQV